MLTEVELQSRMSRRSRACLWALLFLAIAESSWARCTILAQQNSGAPQTSFQAEPLTLNKQVAGVLSPNASLAYAISLTTNEYLKLEIIAGKIDLTVLDPRGQIVAERACDQRQLTPVSVVAKSSGSYRFVLRLPQGSRSVQHYTLRPVERRSVVASDVIRLQAEQSFARATLLKRKWETVASQNALKLFQQAQRLWKSLRDLQGESLALLSLGRTYEALDETSKALDCYEQALTLSERSSDQRRRLETLVRLANHHANAGENTLTVDHGNRALTLARQLLDKHLEAEILNHLGDAQYGFGDLPLALELYRQSFELWESVDSPAGQAQVNISFGYAYLNRSEAEKSGNAYRDALIQSNQAGDRHLEALARRALGNLQTKVGQPQRALDSFRKALALIERGEGQLLKARVLAGIGHAYERLGDSEMALQYDSDAIAIFKKLGNKWGEGELQMDLGRVYYFLREPEKALACYERALSLFNELKMPRFEAQTLSSMGLVYASRGDAVKALHHYESSLNLTRKNQDQRYDAYTLNYLGELRASSGNHDEALTNFEQALALNRQASDPVGEAMTLYNLARLRRDMGSLSDAVKYSDEALDIVESVRMALAGEKLRTSFGASVHQHFELRVDILMRQHQLDPSLKANVAALEVSERGRARAWLESLKESRSAIREGVDQSLLDRADKLQTQLDAKAQDQIRLMSRPHTKREEQTLARELRKLTTDYEEVQGEIRANSQRYAALSGPVPLTGKEIQQQLDRDTLLLEFSCGEDRSYAWVVSPEWIKSVELPGRKDIEARSKRLYAALSARARREDPLSKRTQPSLAEADAEVERLTKELSSTILAPLSDLLADKRLVIVADGALQYVPFEVLDDPRVSNHASPEPLIARHEIVYLPSASVLAEQRASLGNRRLAPKTLAIFADPVFDETDARVSLKSTSRSGRRDGHTSPSVASRAARAQKPTTPSASAITGALRDAGFEHGIPRLPYSNQEARRIISLVPETERLTALGFDANRKLATGRELASYRFLHFATHGLLNSEHPELSGILLSMIDGEGKSQNGLLQLHEIYNLNLPVELVALSACQTALGKEVRGEGLFGLTRGFMYAGARRAVSSLWKVDDSATSELMTRFYKELLVNGNTPAASLRIAKNDLRKEKVWRHPFHWAGFIIQGEWR